MSTMKAWRLHSYGGPECLQLDDIPVPVPTESQVLVATSIVGVNPFDWKLREGFMDLPLPAILGIEFSGTVVAVGDKTSRFKVGDRVMAISNTLRTFAEFIAVEETTVARVPAALSDVDAGSLPMVALTAWESLHRAGEVRPGMHVLIHGASGSVGAFAVQFAKAEGATVIGTGPGKNREYVTGLGADQFVDYQKENFEDRVKKVDLVLDYVLLGGDKNTSDRSCGVLSPDGAIVSVADPSVPGKAPEGLKGYFLQTSPDAARLEAIAELLVIGKIQSKVSEVFPRSELAKAMEINRAGGRTGRLLVDFKRA